MCAADEPRSVVGWGLITSTFRVWLGRILVGLSGLFACQSDLTLKTANGKAPRDRTDWKMLSAEIAQMNTDFDQRMLSSQFDSGLTILRKKIEFLEKYSFPEDQIRAAKNVERSITQVSVQGPEKQQLIVESMKLHIISKRYERRNDAVTAAEFRQKSLDKLREVYTQDNVMLLTVEADVLRIKAHFDKPESVRPRLERAKERCITLMGDNNLLYGQILDSIAGVEERNKDWAAALPFRGRSCEILEQYTPDGLNFVMSMARLANCQRKVGKFAEALKSSQKAVAAAERYDGIKSSSALVTAWLVHGSVLLSADKPMEADTFLRKAEDLASELREGVVPADTLDRLKTERTACLKELNKKRQE